MFLELLDFTNDPEYSVAIIIAKNRYGTNHTGILTKQGNNISFFHLAWHLNIEHNNWDEFLVNENLASKKWIKFNSLTGDAIVANVRVPGIIKFLELIYRKNKSNIPYSIKFKETKFTMDGNLSLGENEIGLTCATFVYSFFNSVAIDLVDLNTWPSRQPEDSNWKAFILDMMLRTKVPTAHIINVAKEEINFRLKPEEIAISSSKEKDQLPADFEFCSTVGGIFNTL
jgi:hypothetical protein